MKKPRRWKSKSKADVITSLSMATKEELKKVLRIIGLIRTMKREKRARARNKKRLWPRKPRS